MTRPLLQLSGVTKDYQGERRGVAAVTLTADQEFAAVIAARVLTLEPATGRLAERRRSWFRGA